MNSQVYSIGYRFENKDYGNFESKFITASLLQGPPDEVTTYYQTQDTKPIGYYGSSLGYEWDLKYWRTLNNDIDVGAAGGALLPGKAWQTDDEQKPVNTYLIQAYIVYNF